MHRIEHALAGVVIVGAGSMVSTGIGTVAVSPRAPAVSEGKVYSRVSSTSDTVVIRVAPDVAIVHQRLPAFDGVVEAHAIRLERQELRIEESRRGEDAAIGVEVRELAGAYHLRVTGDEPLDVSYRITGDLGRLPLFVPSAEAQLAVGPIVLRVELSERGSSGLDLGTSLPRFSREADGALTANLSNPPAFVRLDRAGGLSFARAADLVVVLFIFGAAVWAWRVGRRTAMASLSSRISARRDPSGGVSGSGVSGSGVSGGDSRDPTGQPGTRD